MNVKRIHFFDIILGGLLDFFLCFFLWCIYFGYLSIDSSLKGVEGRRVCCANTGMIWWSFFPSIYLFIYVVFGLLELSNNNNITETRLLLYVIKSLTLTFMQPSKCWSNRESTDWMVFRCCCFVLCNTLSKCSGTEKFCFI